MKKQVVKDQHSRFPEDATLLKTGVRQGLELVTMGHSLRQKHPKLLKIVVHTICTKLIEQLKNKKV